MIPSRALRANLDLVLAIAARHRARNVRVFGSVARGEDNELSDLDLLIDMDDDRPLSDLALFADEVHEALHCAVQAVTPDDLHSLLKD